MSNERTDGEDEPSNETPGERPSWAGPRDEAVDQPLPPDLESMKKSFEPEPSTLSYIDQEKQQATFGMSPRTDEEQAAIDARVDAERSGQPVAGTPTAGGMTRQDIDAVSDLPVDTETPTADPPGMNSVFSVTRDGTIIETPVGPQDPGDQDYVYSVRRDGSIIETPVTRRWNPRILYGVAAVIAVVAVGAILALGGGGGDDDTASAGTGSTGASGAQAAAPTNPPAATSTPAAPAAPSGFTANAQQVRNANVIATDLAAMYGTCVYEITTNGATDVEQSVSSSPAMMQAMTAAGYQGARSASRAPTPCQGLPYNAASVSGNARDVAAAQALFTAARSNYQALFPGFTPFDAPKGGQDDLYCQHGVFPPAGNVIAVACWMRKGTSITGVFILLPPNSAQTAIDEAKRDATAFIQRVDGVLR